MNENSGKGYNSLIKFYDVKISQTSTTLEDMATMI